MVLPARRWSPKSSAYFTSNLRSSPGLAPVRCSLNSLTVFSPPTSTRTSSIFASGFSCASGLAASDDTRRHLPLAEAGDAGELRILLDDGVGLAADFVRWDLDGELALAGVRGFGRVGLR